MACYSMEEMMAAHEFVANSFEIQVDEVTRWLDK